MVELDQDILPFSTLEASRMTIGSRTFEIHDFGLLTDLATGSPSKFCPSEIAIPQMMLPVLEFTATVITPNEFTIDAKRGSLLSSPASVHTETNDMVLAVWDKQGRQCGVIFGLAAELSSDDVAEYVAVSKYQEVPKDAQSLKTVHGDISLFDNRAFASEQKGEGLICILLVE